MYNRMNLFRVKLGNAPLKSILSRSDGCVAFTRFESIGLKKQGWHSAQILQEAVMAFTSSTEAVIFFILR